MSLNFIINDMVSYVQVQRLPCSSRLGNGLTVRLEYVSDVMIQLEIKRNDVTPSLTEWFTVLDHFPWPVGRIAPKIEGFKFSARLPIHPRLLGF